MLKLDTIFRRQFEASQKRLAICRECPHFVEMTTKCKQCGCFMKAKTLMLYEECPLGKWGKE